MLEQWRFFFFFFIYDCWDRLKLTLVILNSGTNGYRKLINVDIDNRGTMETSMRREIVRLFDRWGQHSTAAVVIQEEDAATGS